MNPLKALGEYLKSQTIITESVSDRIYRDTLKSSEIPTPCIIYNKDTAETKNDFGAKKSSNIIINVVDSYEDQDEAELIRENIKNLLVGKCGSLTEDWYGKIVLKEEKDTYNTPLRQAVRSLTLTFLEF